MRTIDFKKYHLPGRRLEILLHETDGQKYMWGRLNGWSRSYAEVQIYLPKGFIKAISAGEKAFFSTES